MRILRKSSVFLLTVALCMSTLYITATAGVIAYGAATVGATSLNMRSGPETTYSIVTTIPHDETIVILEKTNADWYRAVYNGVEGYVATLYLTEIVTAENFTATGKLTGDDVFLRSSPDTSADSLGTCSSGAKVDIIGINSGWYKVVYSGTTAYIRSDFITLVSNEETNAPPSGTNGTSSGQQSAGASSSETDETAEETSLRQQVVNFAVQYIGGSYVYGGQSPSVGFDCSGFVYYVFRHFGYDVARTASSQYAQDGVSITKSDLLPGDLVFFSSNSGYSVTHVGIYIGNNQFVHASCPKIGVVISNLDSSYYSSGWYGAKRLLS